MTIFNPNKFVTRSLMGAVGLSAIALFGVAESVKAVDINAGIDYLITPSPEDGGLTQVDLSPFGINAQIPFKGVPTFKFTADTLVERKEDCTFVAGECTVGLQIVGLNLTNAEPIPGFGDQVVFLTLDDSIDPQPMGDITLMDNGDGTASWINFLPVPWKLVDENGDPIVDQNLDPIVGLAEFDGSGIGIIQGNRDFIVQEFDDQDLLDRHQGIGPKVPEPSTTLGLLLLGLGSVVGIKRRDKVNK